MGRPKMRRLRRRRRQRPCVSGAAATAIKRFHSPDSYSIDPAQTDPAQVEGETRPNRKTLVESMAFRHGLVTYTHCRWGLWLIGNKFKNVLIGEKTVQTAGVSAKAFANSSYDRRRAA
jgi:hypothetical protein